ncbi:ABC transporter ATP-binding protein [Microbacterium sp. bgisy203]|uniref:ABC transporter ATP-binding protein n=1 Tax=Microbacterium sp. bgisy203 TaxID=3413799 RepID=UPI003D752E83
MTASLPLPEDLGNDAGGDVRPDSSAPAKKASRQASRPRAIRAPRGATPPVAQVVPPPPALSAAEAAAEREARASQASLDDIVVAPDLVVPPRPPLPEPEAETEVDSETPAAEDSVPPLDDPAPALDDPAPAVDDLASLEIDVDEAVPALRVRGVTKSFGQNRAVDGLDLTIPAGTFYGIVGPNGAGKTTALSMIAGLLRPDAGSIEVAGVDLGADTARAKRQMGILPDRLRTFDRLTGRQLLYYYGVLRGLRSAVVESRTADLARAFDLTDALGRQVSDFSTGMTKKIMLAGAMIHSPRVLVLDEPFESVDPVSSAVILDILSAYVAHGGTVILSSHGMELVERVCSGVAVIVAGRVLAAGTVDEVRSGRTLTERFIELSGGPNDAEGLEWLHTFSD